MSRIFINYRRQDTEGYVGRIYDHLLRHFERDDIFMDVDAIHPGADFVKVLEDAIAQCDVLLAVIGPQWVNAVDENGERRLDQWNDFVRIEIATALEQNKLVIPVLVGRARMPSPKEIPEALAGLTRRHAVELSHQRFALDIDKLAESIRTAVPEVRGVKPARDSETIRRKEALLKVVRDDLINATDSPLYNTRVEMRYYPVLGEGHPDAAILFIGESPGKTEAEIGRPFVGASGEVLEEMLRSINLNREDVYMTNILLDRPPVQREPLPEELTYYGGFMDRIIDIIQPRVIATLGRFSMQYVLKKFDLPEKRGKISNLHGKLIKASASYGEIHIVPLFHPAVVLYSATQKETLRQDFQKLKLFL